MTATQADTGKTSRKTSRKTANIDRGVRNTADGIEVDVTPAAPARQATRSIATGRVEVEGRDGSILSRKRTGAHDIFHIPPHLIPPGWDYQWNPYTVMGETQVSSQIAMAENGWRPVPADRHPGFFMPEGYKGNIIRDGLVLEERPMELSMEARHEDKVKADALVRDNRAQFGLGSRIGHGMSEDQQRYRGVGPAVKTSIGPAPEILRPQLEIAPD